jgi:hypothetical protein
MPRPRVVARRLFAALLALWFAVAASEGAAAHACPMHDGSVAREASPPMRAAAATHAEHGVAHDTHAAPADDADGHAAHGCSCPGVSCGASGMALAAARRSTHFAIAVADVRTVFAPATAHRPVADPSLRPFANGPPAAPLA